MFTKADILKDIEEIGIRKNDTLLVHSSMRAIGETENGADTVLDAFIEYLSEDGLLIFPTHTWGTKLENGIFDPKTSEACVGILPNLFMKRKGVIRSLHPTHSLAALGSDAYEFTKGEENYDTPCSRAGCYGKLYDRHAKILFIGCTLSANTYMHGVEEWYDVPDRLSPTGALKKILMPDGSIMERTMRGHIGKVWLNYTKCEPLYIKHNIATVGKIGDARSLLCDCVKMADFTGKFLLRNPDLFKDDLPMEE